MPVSKSCFTGNIHMKIKIFLFLVLVSLVLCFGCVQNKKNKESQAKIGQSDTTLNQLAELNKKIRADSVNGNLYNQRAKYYLEQENYNDAFKDITSALEIDSTASDYYITLSDIYLGMTKLQSAIEALDKAAELDPENKNAYLKLAEIDIIFKDYKKALDNIDKAMKIDKLDAKSYFLRGVVMLENGDTTKGILNFQKAIDVNQEYFDAYLQLGLLYSAKKNKLAVDYFNNALNIEPENTEVNYFLALFYQENAQYDRAIQIYNRMLDKDPKFYYALYNIGYINLVYLKDFQVAIDYFSKAIDINPTYTDAYYNRGFAYELQKDAVNARKDYKKALELKPNYEKAVAGLNRIDEYLSTQQ